MSVPLPSPAVDTSRPECEPTSDAWRAWWSDLALLGRPDPAAFPTGVLNAATLRLRSAVQFPSAALDPLRSRMALVENWLTELRGSAETHAPLVIRRAAEAVSRELGDIEAEIDAHARLDLLFAEWEQAAARLRTRRIYEPAAWGDLVHDLAALAASAPALRTVELSTPLASAVRFVTAVPPEWSDYPGTDRGRRRGLLAALLGAAPLSGPDGNAADDWASTLPLHIDGVPPRVRNLIVASVTDTLDTLPAADRLTAQEVTAARLGTSPPFMLRSKVSQPSEPDTLLATSWMRVDIAELVRAAGRQPKAGPDVLQESA